MGNIGCVMCDIFNTLTVQMGLQFLGHVDKKHGTAKFRGGEYTILKGSNYMLCFLAGVS